MTPDDVRAAAERLTQFHQRFAPCFGKDEAQNHAYVYVKGLMTCPDRKSIEPIALLLGGGRVSALQKFINSAPGITTRSRPRSRRSSPTTWSPPPRPVPWVSSGSSTRAASPRKATTVPASTGNTTAAWARKTTARSGSSWSARRTAGTALLDHRLYLPESWCEDNEAGRDRRAKAHIPEAVAFQTKPQIAADLVRRTVATDSVRLDWITADELYGRNGEFLDELEALERRYVVEVPVTTTVWTQDPASCVPAYSGRGRVPTLPGRESVRSVVDVISDLEPGRWQRLCVGRGAKWPLVYDFAAVRAWAVRHGRAGAPVWVLVRRSLEAKPEVKYYISNGDEQTPLEVLARVAWRGIGSRSSSRMPRATWGWRSTRRGRGSGGTIT